MAFDFGRWLPYIITGGASVAGAVIGSRASGRAAELSAEASERSAETQLQLSREQIKNLRDIYNLDLSLNWPRHRLASESLGQLALGSGSKLPMSTFETTDKPPELPGAGGPTPPGGGGGQVPPGVDPLNPNTVAPIQVPPGGPPSRGGSIFGGASSGAGLGATIGSVVPGIGTAVGAGVGALAGGLYGVFGGDQRIADHIVPSQNELTERIGVVGSELGRRISDGSVTEQDWESAIQIVNDMRSKFYDFADQTAGGNASGARQSIDEWVNPMLQVWGMRETQWPKDWRTWKPPAAPPSRQFGGPVRSLASMGKPGGRRPYKVGEKGPEMYVPSEGGQPAMVGMGGPEIRSFPEDGYIVPNHDLPEQQQGMTYNLSELGNGVYGMPGGRPGGMRGRPGIPQRPWHRPMPWMRQGGMRGRPPGRMMEPRAEGGPVMGEEAPVDPEHPTVRWGNNKGWSAEESKPEHIKRLTAVGWTDNGGGVFSSEEGKNGYLEGDVFYTPVDDMYWNMVSGQSQKGSPPKVGWKEYLQEGAQPPASYPRGFKNLGEPGTRSRFPEPQAPEPRAEGGPVMGEEAPVDPEHPTVRWGNNKGWSAEESKPEHIKRLTAVGWTDNGGGVFSSEEGKNGYLEGDVFYTPVDDMYWNMVSGQSQKGSPPKVGWKEYLQEGAQPPASYPRGFKNLGEPGTRSRFPEPQAPEPRAEGGPVMGEEAPVDPEHPTVRWGNNKGWSAEESKPEHIKRLTAVGWTDNGGGVFSSEEGKNGYLEGDVFYTPVDDMYWNMVSGQSQKGSPPKVGWKEYLQEGAQPPASYPRGFKNLGEPGTRSRFPEPQAPEPRAEGGPVMRGSLRNTEPCRRRSCLGRK